MTRLRIDKENLTDEAGKIIFQFPQPIKKEINDKERIYVLLIGLTQDSGYVPYLRGNIWCVDFQGNKLWVTEELKTKKNHDCYSNLFSDNGKIFGISWSGYQVEIDKNTGKMLGEEFLK